MKKISTLARSLYHLNLRKIFSHFGIHKILKEHLAKEQSSVTKLSKPIKPRKTEKAIRYIHIGYPKSASTALQRGFFGRHQQLLHLGCGNDSVKGYWDDHGYIDKHVNMALEIDLRFKNDLSYDQAQVKGIFENYFLQSDSNKMVSAVGISNENICFNWHGGIDTTTKAKRLFGIFESGTKILMVVRRQTDLIRSLYKETVRFGYNGSFDDYLKYIWQYQDRNFLSDLNYDRVFNLYAHLFGRENIKVFFFEEMRENSKQFLKRISNELELDDRITHVESEYNEQLTDRELAIKLELNRRFPHSFESGFLHPFDTHRFIPYYTDFLREPRVDNEHYIDYHFRNSLCDLSKKLAPILDIDDINLSWESNYGGLIKDLLNASNQNFKTLTGDSLLEKYNYLSL
ncbi:hypothetical protein [Marinoscillum sp. 108]|uniref:Sulfotransferase domain-containing protein n=1 Tax=Marinoscillum luteum TaxID=861051 RepID=A0ABW7NBV8_9BACT|nr:hypothetical protein [Marinoscillum sp. 108]VXD20489.1 conserved hypothetical protein [Marinoscillum sp. 108]